MHNTINCLFSKVAEEMLRDFDPESGTGTTLHQDATTFNHSHYQGMQVCTYRLLLLCPSTITITL